MSISLPYIGQTVYYFFSGLEDKIYPAMDLPVYGESDGVSCILVVDCIQKL